MLAIIKKSITWRNVILSYMQNYTVSGVTPTARMYSSTFLFCLINYAKGYTWAWGKPGTYLACGYSGVVAGVECLDIGAVLVKTNWYIRLIYCLIRMFIYAGCHVFKSLASCLYYSHAAKGGFRINGYILLSVGLGGIFSSEIFMYYLYVMVPKRPIANSRAEV